MNGDRIPRDEDVIRKLAVRLGLEIYDILGMDRPDPDLFYLQEHWEELSPEFRRRVIHEGREDIARIESKRPKRRPS